MEFSPFLSCVVFTLVLPDLRFVSTYYLICCFRSSSYCIGQLHSSSNTWLSTQGSLTAATSLPSLMRLIKVCFSKAFRFPLLVQGIYPIQKVSGLHALLKYPQEKYWTLIAPVAYMWALTWMLDRLVRYRKRWFCVNEACSKIELWVIRVEKHYASTSPRYSLKDWGEACSVLFSPFSPADQTWVCEVQLIPV